MSEFKKVTREQCEKGVADGNYAFTHKDVEVQYRVRDNTWYPGNFDDTLVDLLEKLRKNDRVVRFDYGDMKTGQSWSEEMDTQGRIGRSTGWIKAALVVPDNEIGGDILSNVVAVMDLRGKDLYRHPEYKAKYDWSVAKIEMNTNVDAVLSGKELPFKINAPDNTQAGSPVTLVAAFESLSQAKDFLGEKKRFEKSPAGPSMG